MCGPSRGGNAHKGQRHLHIALHNIYCIAKKSTRAKAQTIIIHMQSSEIEGFLIELADASSERILPHFRARPPIHNKAESGFDPVTEADAGAERIIRELISDRYPGHGIIGEEEAPTNADAEKCWIIDPIDGTRAFIAGLPSWGTLIGLTIGGRPIAGMMHQPFTGEKFIATQAGSFLIHGTRKTPLATSDVQSLSAATLMTTSPDLFSTEGRSRFKAVESHCLQARYGFDCYAYAMIAAGQVDIVVESDLKIFDIAPLIPLIEQAGGIVTDWDGNSAASGGDILACANSALHAEALDLLRRA